MTVLLCWVLTELENKYRKFLVYMIKLSSELVKNDDYFKKYLKYQDWYDYFDASTSVVYTAF
jgi:hypothetical protein